MDDDDLGLAALIRDGASGSAGANRSAPDRNLGLELVRVTEAAALAAARLMGRGEEDVRPVHPLISHVTVPPLSVERAEALVDRASEPFLARSMEALACERGEFRVRQGHGSHEVGADHVTAYLDSAEAVEVLGD